MPRESFHFESALLLVVEGRAAAPLWLGHLGPAPRDGWTMLEQEEWESATAFQSRLGETLDRDALDPHGARVIVLVASDWMDERSQASRRQLAASLLAHLARQGGGEFVVTHGYGHDSRAREELAQFVALLADEWQSSGIVVSTRFAEAPRRSEVRKVSEPRRYARASGVAWGSELPPA
jgi:hypothetical protein